MRIHSKKLQLHRETVHQLDPETLSGIRGGEAVGKVSSDNRQCTYSQLCSPGVEAPAPAPAFPIGQVG